mmetsp:Transcript_15420/g.34005  ORF Transcript_15420/g.34005 Transcript_15420/m.34005 type:complete len:100 (+) Transcript_15420:3-302(+)
MREARLGVGDLFYLRVLASKGDSQRGDVAEGFGVDIPGGRHDRRLTFEDFRVLARMDPRVLAAFRLPNTVTSSEVRLIVDDEEERCCGSIFRKCCKPRR